eukprot:CAMPEP_0184855800 /NCGR_PEP_ID=MMETSP0580-20130426/950_1 /TAXON_ID=1118495 /ORGANISM="Dactyliosolen fragilissimus" /LENGTH=40 /DNA_ID= /DNA_START= /DNA_END= /DNA_ORIENTATION=
MAKKTPRDTGAPVDLLDSCAIEEEAPEVPPVFFLSLGGFC